MKNKITIVQIAKLAGVNPSTVSRALHAVKSSHISEELRQKIQKICEEHNYRPQIAAKGFAFRKSYRVGLLLGRLRGDLMSPHFSLFIQGICDSLQKAGYTLSILWCEMDGEENIEKNVRNFLFSDVADAYIMGTTLLKKQSVEMFRSTGRPIVALSNHPAYKIDNFHQVKLDFSKAMQTIWAQMPEKAMKNIVAFSLVNNNKFDLLRQYAPPEADIRFLNPGIQLDDTIGLRLLSEQTAEKYWDTLKQAKVIWCDSDLTALGICDLYRKKGLIPGKDILVIGHDNFEQTCYKPPRKTCLSTIDPHWLKAGQTTGEFTLRCIDEKEPAGSCIAIDATFIKRKTFPYNNKKG